MLGWCARYERLSVPPATMIASWEDAAQIDVRDVLPLVRMPTLILSHKDSPLIPVGQGRYLADNISEARYVEFEGSDIWLFSDPRLTDEITSFLGEPSVHTRQKTTGCSQRSYLRTSYRRRHISPPSETDVGSSCLTSTTGCPPEL